ncbi:DUF305 domain-containing protein [Streptomyces sp. ME19-01-6]|uniref:DUF305 domain-containing protein n=1 Tax=Streptomyces sp. ME19-01-6 TaxID=3028686 RepID=UPI0029BCA82B|nr:DUF305 domain-containing protein [Streptomyces sp. ME19-01-6]MDX3226852.1 DUF305 domain-containing protein [Streptomyces sp. ME19-01-6]
MTDTGQVADTGRAGRQPLIAGISAALALLTLVAVGVLWLTADRSDGTTGPSKPTDTSAEAGFARDMSIHHQQAVEMSFIVRDTTDDEDVRRLAYDIINTQANQRGMMLGWLNLWGLSKTSEDPPMTWMKDLSSDESMDHGSMGSMGAMDGTYKPHDGSLMPGMATNTQLEALRKSKGRAAEVMYLRLMIAHHKGGIDMAKGAVKLAKDPTVKRLAQGMVDSQQSEIQLMNDMLKERGAKPVS